MKDDLINYTTIREEFTNYKCENKLILRHKPVLAAMYGNHDLPSTLDIEEIRVTIVGKGWTPNKQASIMREHNEKDYDLRWEPIKPVINIYETDTNLLFLYPVMTRIFLEEISDKNGNPKLSCTSRTIINVIDKNALSRETKNESRDK
ncbi:MAG: hypothetical protein MPJ04_01215 [Nitrosopumilus sp.]|nr:hypothetical protein [Nitrosopumilus sp.]MDA7944431.1 hypothetical protein [Nitrosopumilus sp.]MDA7954183.1 hypothetical protein [Nitrosopumilus sp.]MDA7959462.1 hypothetical protein [Nitrosopumilus sp.]MDA7973221.1 hypothetical protein [Nitrosopumilus sp.]